MSEHFLSGMHVVLAYPLKNDSTALRINSVVFSSGYDSPFINENIFPGIVDGIVFFAECRVDLLIGRSTLLVYYARSRRSNEVFFRAPNVMSSCDAMMTKTPTTTSNTDEDEIDFSRYSLSLSLSLSLSCARADPQQTYE